MRRGLFRGYSLLDNLCKFRKKSRFFSEKPRFLARAGKPHDIDSQAARGKNSLVRSSTLSFLDSFSICRRPERLLTTLGNLRGHLGRSRRHRPRSMTSFFRRLSCEDFCNWRRGSRSLLSSSLPRNSMTTLAPRKDPFLSAGDDW